MNKKKPETKSLSRDEVLNIVKKRCDGVIWGSIAEEYGMDTNALLKEVKKNLFYPKQKNMLDYDTPLANWMKENCIGYKEMEARTGYSYRSIYSVVSNRYRVSQDALECISIVCGIPKNKLYPNGMPPTESEARKDGKSACKTASH